MKGAQITVIIILLIVINYCQLNSACIALGGNHVSERCSRHFFVDERQNRKSLEVEDDEKTDNDITFLHDARTQNSFISTVRDENEEFLHCCHKQHLPEVCLKKCSYNRYERSAFQSMFLQIDSCPLQLATDIHFCAAQGQDHRKCCIRNGVTTTAAGKKCLIFCDQSVQHKIVLDLSYLPCFERFDTIKHCFWRSARDNHLVEISKRSRINKWQSNFDHISETNPKQSSLSVNSYP